MKLRTLSVNVISANDLEDVNLVTRMKAYVVVSLSGEVPSDQEFKTVVDSEGRRNPNWNCTMKFNINELADQSLVFSLRTQRVLGDREVGKVTVPIADLLQSASDDDLTFATYQVNKPGKTSKGALYFSYQFGNRRGSNFGKSQSAAGAYSYPSSPLVQPASASDYGPHHPYHKDVYPPPPEPLQLPRPLAPPPPPPSYSAYPPFYPSPPPPIPSYVPCYPPSYPPPTYPYSTQSAHWPTPYPPIERSSWGVKWMNQLW